VNPSILVKEGAASIDEAALHFKAFKVSHSLTRIDLKTISNDVLK